MDTIHDLPARAESSGGIARTAQTIAMLAETLARQRQAIPDRTGDAFNRSAVAQAQASAERRAAAHDLSTPDKLATPTVDEHAVGVGAGLEHSARAERDMGAAALSLTETREAVAVVRVAASQSAVGGLSKSASASRQHAVSGRIR